MRAKESLEVWGNGKEIRDFLHAEDLVNFIKKVLRQQKTSYEIFNCGSGKPITVKDLCKKIIEISNKDIEIKFNKTKPSIPFDMYLDCTKAKKEIGWTPQIEIDQGIKKTISWWKKNIKK